MINRGAILEGKALKYGDHIDTDLIIPARYCTSYKKEELGPHCMEGADPLFNEKVEPGDILVAGENYGCGSSRENAPLAIKGAGISAVIAKSFARIFYRNSINIGLPILESDKIVDCTEEGDIIRIDLTTGVIENLTREVTGEASAFPPLIRQIIDGGGMVPYIRERLKGKGL
jgi:3-isopropylmalate/(R)-2-methylmalate dehydratase small subunit